MIWTAMCLFMLYIIYRLMKPPVEEETEMRDIEFIDYDGKFPCFCSGTLFYAVNGEFYAVDKALDSGDHHKYDFDKKKFIAGDGKWKWNYSAKDRMDLTEEEMDELLKQVNDHVPHGCCGGCK